MITSVPVSVFGNVYSSLSLVQGTSGDLAALGATLGSIAQVPNTGKLVMLVQFKATSTYLSGTLAAADGSAMKFTSDPVASSANYIVDAVTTAGDFMIGCNDNSSTTVPKGYYFWITIKGPAQILCTTTIAAFTQVAPGATAGQLSAYTSSYGSGNIQTMASSGSGGKTDCFIY